MKQAIKNILGQQNVQRIALLRKTVQIQTRRFYRTMTGGSERLPALPTRTFSIPDAHVFFGYYDVPQFNEGEVLLLAMAAPNINRTPLKGEQIKLGFFDLRERPSIFRKIATTETWCWQQGCRLQWYPYKGSKAVIYNTMVDGNYGCVIQDVDDLEVVKSFSRPVYSVSPDGKWGLSLDFSRLQRLRPGYGYNVRPDISINSFLPIDDGIWRINLITGEEKLLFSLQDVSQIEPCEEMVGAQHYFNHILFNPAGNRFMLFHIWQGKNNKRMIRLLTSSIEGDNVFLLNSSGYVSHYCWKNDEHLLAYSTVNGKGEGYYLYDDCTGSNKIIDRDILTEDGHPSFLPGKKWIITDTYPNEFGEQSLLLYHGERNKVVQLTKEYNPAKFHAETRCDLHPRISRSGRYVCIDCIVGGRRVMKLFDINTFIAYLDG